MTPNEYQDLCKETITEESNNMNYLALGLASESGEVAGKQKKVIRGDYELEDIQHLLIAELGDCLWYIAMIARYLGVRLEDVMLANIEKLKQRALNDKIKGDGDER